VAAHDGGTAFHRVAWLRAAAESLGHRGFALEARDANGTRRGVLPLVHVASPLFGRFLVGVPFASYGGPLGHADAVEALSTHAVALARRLDVSLLELRARRPLAATPSGLEVSTRKLTVTLPLDGGADATFARFPSKLRSQIRRAEKDGVTVRVAPHQVDAFYAVYAHHMRDLGTPALPRAFFEALARGFGDDLLFAIATLDEVPVACGAGFRYGAEFEITWASALRAYNKLSPNMAMYWRLMAHLADAGVQTFNFGRCTADSGTHRFKRQWGGVDEPLPWYQWRASGAPASTPAPGGKFSLAQSAWTRLPLPVANAIGPRIARLLP
jgi:FemAB-related protein (PEP-CTERM system-associated)